MHYKIDSARHLQVISKKGDILDVFDLGTIEIIERCECDEDCDHGHIGYILHKLEVLPWLQIYIAGWPCIGKIRKSVSWENIESDILNNEDWTNCL